jgi:hypothetical protein
MATGPVQKPLISLKRNEETTFSLEKRPFSKFLFETEEHETLPYTVERAPVVATSVSRNGIWQQLMPQLHRPPYSVILKPLRHQNQSKAPTQTEFRVFGSIREVLGMQQEHATWWPVRPGNRFRISKPPPQKELI